MQLSLRTDYALRMLMTLAVKDGVISVDWVAEHHGISRNHLAKVAQDLALAGFIKTYRGRGGGVSLARAPGAINVGSVVRQLENTEGFVACMGDQALCAIDGVCGLKPALGRALEAFLTHLDGYSLAQITGSRSAVLERLGVDA